MNTPRKLRIGSPATGNNFFPRNSLRERLLRALSRDNVAFLGPRRTGKTSILLDLNNNPLDGVEAIKLDLQGLRSVPAWLKLMLSEARKRFAAPQTSGAKKAWQITRTKSEAVLKRIDEITALGNGIKLQSGQPAVDSWQPVADEFLALLKELEQPIYFLLDEFPWFLGHVAKNHTPAEVDATLNWFRKVRLELSDLSVRFLVTGSIGLNGLLRRLELSPAANDFDSIEIKPLTDAESATFLREVAEGECIPITDECIQRILDRIGVGWPILLATFLSEVQDHFPGGGERITVDDIDRIYEQQMVRGSRNKYCEEMYTRLTKEELFTVSERRLAQEILRRLCRSSRGFGTEELRAIHEQLVPDDDLRMRLAQEVDVVIETLTHDGYLIRRESSNPELDGRLEFASHILRDFWRHRTV
ncbi:MAG: hypothetical protein KDA89_13845 [Planctomycetaceae bacterium]|nr:hypothetical protein [Planctomycetaceae bacterium]